MMFRIKYFKTCGVLGSVITETHIRDAIIPCSHHRAPWEGLGAGAAERQAQALMPVTAANLMCICSPENAANLCHSHSLESPEETQDGKLGNIVKWVSSSPLHRV